MLCWPDVLDKKKKHNTLRKGTGTGHSWLEGLACQPGQTHQNQPRSKLNKLFPCVGVYHNKLSFYGLLCFVAEKGMIKAVYWNTPAGVRCCPKAEFYVQSRAVSMMLLHFKIAWLMKAEY